MLRWEGVEIGRRYTVAGFASKTTDAIKLINGQVFVTSTGLKVTHNNCVCWQRSRVLQDPLSILQAGKLYVNTLLDSRSIFAENVTADTWRALNGR